VLDEMPRDLLETRGDILADGLLVDAAGGAESFRLWNLHAVNAALHSRVLTSAWRRRWPTAVLCSWPACSASWISRSSSASSRASASGSTGGSGPPCRHNPSNSIWS
jgi:hypothetical protein